MTSQRPYRKLVVSENFHIHINPAIEKQRKALIKQISMPTLQRKILSAGKLPPEASKVFQDLAELAAQLMVERAQVSKKLRAEAKKAKTESYETTAPVNEPDCDKYNTIGNAILQIMGFCTDWDECMYGMQERVDNKWKEILENYEPGENPWADCAPDATE